MAVTQTQVAALYVSIFNRASEGTGNTFWQSATSATDAATAMLATSDAATYFGTSLATNQAFVEHIYLNTLNKTVAQDTAGVKYWVDLLNAGTSRGEVVSGLVSAVATYATSTDPVTKAAYDQFANRVTVSDYTAQTLATAPTNFATSTSFNTASNTTGALTVSNDLATVTTANAAINLIVTPARALTTSTDSLVGTSASDTFTSAAGTLATADTILDSSSTDSDVLTATVTGNSSAPRVQNIETININGQYTTAGLDLASVSGTTTLNVNSGIVGGTATVTNASSLNALNINAGANIGTVSVTATASGTRDTVYVNAGSATAVTIVGGAGIDTFGVTVGTGATVNLNTASTNIDKYQIESNNNFIHKR